MVVRWMQVCCASPVLRFLVVGGVSFSVHAMVFVALRCVLPLTVAFVWAFLVAVTVSWALNRVFTFQSKNNRKTMEWLRYLTVYAFTGLLQTVIFSALVGDLAFMRAHSLVAAMLAAMAVMALNYCLSRRFAFFTRVRRVLPEG
jgi:putative flippase GtrA